MEPDQNKVTRTAIAIVSFLILEALAWYISMGFLIPCTQHQSYDPLYSENQQCWDGPISDGVIDTVLFASPIVISTAYYKFGWPRNNANDLKAADAAAVKK